jgi:hypothetical protein
MCTHTRTDVCEGYHTCLECGLVLGPNITPMIQAYGHRAMGPRRQHYTRMSRWKNLLSRVQGKSCGKLEEAVVKHLKAENPKSVEELYIIMKRYRENKRPKPYESAAVLWTHCSGEMTTVLQFFEEKMLRYMFTMFESRLERDGYSKKPPYPFVLRMFLQEPVLRIEPDRVQSLLRFLPLMCCKWRLRYYQKQYSHVRRVFSKDKSSNLSLKNDVARSPWNRRLLCDKRWEGGAEAADEISRGRVQTVETLLPERIRRRHANVLPPKNRKPEVPEGGAGNPRDIWKTKAIQELLGHAQKWQDARRPVR